MVIQICSLAGFCPLKGDPKLCSSGREGHSLNVLIIPELKSLTSAISRSLSQTGGCVLLAGRSGVGRHSSIRIVSALQSARLITPVAGTNLQFKNDLKMAMQFAGVEGEQVYFLLEDHMIRKTYVLDLVNTFLAAGEVIFFCMFLFFFSLVFADSWIAHHCGIRFPSCWIKR